METQSQLSQPAVNLARGIAKRCRIISDWRSGPELGLTPFESAPYIRPTRAPAGARPWLGAVAQLGERLVRNEEVSGSIPLSSTNLRSGGGCLPKLARGDRQFRAATVGRPVFAH